MRGVRLVECDSRTALSCALSESKRFSDVFQFLASSCLCIKAAMSTLCSAESIVDPRSRFRS